MEERSSSSPGARPCSGRDGLPRLVGWVTAHPEIGFATGLVVGADGNVVECGLVVDAKGEGTPLFRGIPPTQWGSFGGPMWYRNTSAANPWALALKAEAWESVRGINPRLHLPQAFVDLCGNLRRRGYRGVVEPHARVTIGPGPLAPVPPFDPSLGDDPYFHPAYASVVPLRLAAGPEASRARRPRALRCLPPAARRRRDAPLRNVAGRLARCRGRGIDGDAAARGRTWQRAGPL